MKLLLLFAFVGLVGVIHAKKCTCDFDKFKMGEEPYLAEVGINSYDSCDGFIVDDLHLLVAPDCPIKEYTKPRDFLVATALQDDAYQVSSMSKIDDLTLLELKKPMKFAKDKVDAACLDQILGEDFTELESEITKALGDGFCVSK